MPGDGSLAVALSRRSFLAASVAAAGGFLIGLYPRDAAHANDIQGVMPNPFVRIDRTGKVTLILPYVEMGQGAYTSQTQILADELEIDPAQVALEAAPPDEKLYANPFFGGQITGGSGSLRGSWATLRAAGASARIMLIQAAALRWNVDAATCHAANGQVLHRSSGRSVGYGALAEAAARIPIPASPALKTPLEYRIVGRSFKRVDTPAKTNGSAKYGIDAQPPGVRFAVVSACPVFGGTLASVDSTEAMKVRGVQQVVQIDNAVAVVATTTWAARKGLHALNVTWNEGANANLSTADMVAQADAALDKPGLVAVSTGDVEAAEVAAASRYEAVFRLPMLAHAALEPLNCTVHVRPDSCDVWCGSQVVGRAQKAAAEAAGLPLERVAVHNQLLGGGFGRRLETDYVSQAVLLAKQVQDPVKITWSREEDTQHDFYRFHNHSRVTVGLDASGRPISWRHRVVGPNIMARFLPVYQKDGVDLDVVDEASGPYDISNVFIDFTRNEAPAGMATGNWRGVGITRNAVIVESIMDDLAHRIGADPIVYRRSLMTKAPRPLAAMELAATKSGWGDRLSDRTGRGVAVFSGFGSHFALVAQVHVTGTGEVTVERVICAADVGIVVNPDIVRAQLEGGIVFGISAVLYGKITVANGRVEQGNFDSYPVVRMREAPQIDVHIIPSNDDPGGVGEPGTSGAIAAVANAVFAATGHRALTLPLDRNALRSV